MLPPAEEIRYFIETAQAGKISRAAERLGLSQPALSQALQRLEGRLGAPLLIRSKSGVQLTQAGRHLARRGQALLREWDALRSEALKFSQEVSGRYTLGCHAAVARYALPEFLPGLLKTHPQLELRLVHDLSRRIAERVIACEVDFGIVVNPVSHPDLVISELCRDEVSVWSRDGKVTAPLLYDPDLHQAQFVQQRLEKQGHRFARTLTSSHLELLAELAAQGLGSAILPARVAGTYGRRLKPVRPAPAFEDRVCLIYRADTRGALAQRVVVEAIQAAGKTLRQA